MTRKHNARPLRPAKEALEKLKEQDKLLGNKKKLATEEKNLEQDEYFLKKLLKRFKRL